MNSTEINCDLDIIIKGKLLNAQKDAEIVGVFKNQENTNAFLAGYVSCVGETFLLIAQITAGGLYDGFILIELCEIFGIIEKSKYLKKLEILYKLQDQKHLSYNFRESALLYDLLMLSKEKNVVVAIQLLNSGYDNIIGIVQEINDDYVTIDIYDEYGNPDGIQTVNTDLITRIACDTEDEHSIGLLVQSVIDS